MNTIPFNGSTLAFLGQWEVALIGGVIVLLFFGRRVPQMMRSLGQGVTQFKKGIKDVEDGADGKTPAKELPASGGEGKTPQVAEADKSKDASA